MASDIVWSDPSPSDGHRPNRLRGVGTVFGPDITQVVGGGNIQTLLAGICHISDLEAGSDVLLLAGGVLFS